MKLAKHLLLGCLVFALTAPFPPLARSQSRLLTLGVGLMGGAAMILPPDFKFKADFEEMSLTCDGKLVTPIQRGKIEFIKDLSSYNKIKQRTAYAAFSEGFCATR